MKEYRQEIISCFGCPNYRFLKDRDTAVDWCRGKAKVIESMSHIPNWCSLPEREELKEEKDE